jgi:hypothetical protein
MDVILKNNMATPRNPHLELLFRYSFFIAYLMTVLISSTFLLLKCATWRLFYKVSKLSCLRFEYFSCLQMHNGWRVKSCELRTGKNSAMDLLNTCHACYLISSVPTAKHWDNAVNPQLCSSSKQYITIFCNIQSFCPVCLLVAGGI